MERGRVEPIDEFEKVKKSIYCHSGETCAGLDPLAGIQSSQ